MLLTLNSLNNIARFLSLLLIFLFVLAITYATTRFLANYQKGKMQGSNIKILETARLAQDKYLQIIKIGNKVFAVAVSKNSVTYLTELSEEELSYLPEDANPLGGFADVLSRVKAAREKKNTGDPESGAQQPSDAPKLKVFDLTEEDRQEGSHDESS